MLRRAALAGFVACLLLSGCAALRRDAEPAPTPSGPVGRAPVTAQGPSAPARPNLPPARSGRGAYYQDDGPGENPPPNLELAPDAVPVDEPILRSAANRPYVVFGRTYTPLPANAEFRQRGVGSWYGRKFHGQKTSSGEPYDMYAMTAAHPTLPLPSYVRVTNPANGRSVVVRVNDRGPFHAERIIDLSYTAALKLGYVEQGSAQVEVERLRPWDAGVRPPGEALARSGSAASPAPLGAAAGASTASAERSPRPVAAAAQSPASETAVLATTAQADGLYLQLGAFGARENAEEFRIKAYQQLTWLNEAMHIVSRDQLHRVQLGPFPDRSAAQAVADRIRDALQLKPVFVLR
jgi:rare lipoprotein A